MSHISNSAVACGKDISLELKNWSREIGIIWISGQYGTWFRSLNRKKYRVNVTNDNKIEIKTNKFINFMKQYYSNSYKYSLPNVNTNLSLLSVGLRRMVIGAGVGFKKYLRVRGVGYKFELEDKVLTARVGYTHALHKIMPAEFTTRFSRKSKVIRFRSKSLTKLTGFLAELRALRKPDIYKGKGIRYRRDPVRRKPGKRKTKAVSKKRKFNSKQVLPRKLRKRRRRRRPKISFKQKFNKQTAMIGSIVFELSVIAENELRNIINL